MASIIIGIMSMNMIVKRERVMAKRVAPMKTGTIIIASGMRCGLPRSGSSGTSNCRPW